MPGSKLLNSHWLPAVGVFFLAPLVAEFLLGNLPITWLWVLIALAPLYGGAALLIRETARRRRLGSRGILLLGLAFGILQEGLLTFSLFDPGYLGLGLHEYAPVGFLGMGAWWSLYVLSLHAIWSTAVPIAAVEVLAGDRGREPWLGRTGLIAVTLIFLLGCGMVAIFGNDGDFVPSPAQIAGTVVVLGLLGFIALRSGEGPGTRRGRSLSPPVTFIIAFTAASAFLLLSMATEAIPGWVNTALMAAILLGAAMGVHRLGRSDGFSRHHVAALTAAALLAYAWHIFAQPASAPGVPRRVDLIGDCVFAVLAVALCLCLWRASSPPERAPER